MAIPPANPLTHSLARTPAFLVCKYSASFGLSFGFGFSILLRTHTQLLDWVCSYHVGGESGSERCSLSKAGSRSRAWKSMRRGVGIEEDVMFLHGSFVLLQHCVYTCTRSLNQRNPSTHRLNQKKLPPLHVSSLSSYLFVRIKHKLPLPHDTPTPPSQLPSTPSFPAPV
jgi:hypothetical protein